MVVRRLLILLGCLLAPAVHAAVEASVDRNVVEQNESFLLEVVVDGNTSDEPDISALDEDFLVGQSSQMSNTKIINGQISRSMTWSYTLMAREAGEFTIPPILVGNDQSRPIKISVLEPQEAPPGEADVFVTAEVDADTTWVQAQVLYRIKVYRAVATRQPTLREPVITGAEALVEVASEESTYDAILGGRTYNVVERTIAIFPQESGEINISPARFEARVIVNGRITGRKVFESESQAINVKPIPPAPADYPDAAWLPARDLHIVEDWSREPRRLAAGEPVSRTITVGVLGQLETQIPALDIPEPDGISLYPDQPELSRRFESGGIRGVRRDEYAMIAIGNGETSLPAVELPWFDTEEESWQVATLPERRLTIVGAEPVEPVPPEPEASLSAAAEAAPPAAPAVSNPFWQQVAAGLFALWLLTLGAWWWSLRPRQAGPAEPKPIPPHKLPSRCLKQARKAALAGDAPALKDAMLEWGALQWPDTPPRSLGSMAGKVSSPLSEHLMAVSRSSYGPDAPHWDGQAIARSLRSFAVIDASERAADGEVLPPLMPT